jgi:hypothetical protein
MALVLLARVLLVALLLLCARAVLWLVNMLLYAPMFDPLRNLPGPDGTVFESHFVQVME